MYKVLDACGGTLREFPTFEQTNKFRLTANRPDCTIKPDKYFVIYQNHALETHNIVIVNPKSPIEDDLYQQIWIKKEGHQRPKKILSWYKIEE